MKRSKTAAYLLVVLCVVLLVVGYYILGLGSLGCVAESPSFSPEAPQQEACDYLVAGNNEDTSVPLAIAGLVALFVAALFVIRGWYAGRAGNRAVAVSLAIQVLIPILAIALLYAPSDSA